jgi:hypothetical protein
MADNSYISAVKGYLRLGSFPLDASSVFSDINSAAVYAETNPTAYLGQLVAVVDETDRNVTVYKLGYKINQEQEGLELQALLDNGAGGVVKSVNGIEPDINGNVTITIEKLDEILTFLEDTESRVIFNKPISIPTIQIGQNNGPQPNDVVTASYLEARVDDITKGTVRSIELPFTHTGGSSEPIVPGGSIIKKAIVEISSAFNGTIEILVGDQVIFAQSEIFETITGIYIAEPFIILPTTQPKYPIIINVTSATQGIAKFYLDFNLDFIV